MYDKELVKSICSQIKNALLKVEERFSSIQKTEDFTSKFGMEKLDSICMQLIAVGESLKQIDKITSKNLLCFYPEIDWKGVMGFRDIAAHHYFDIDPDQIFWICKNEIRLLKVTIDKILIELE